jgi:hypothetical protein
MFYFGLNNSHLSQLRQVEHLSLKPQVPPESDEKVAKAIVISGTVMALGLILYFLGVVVVELAKLSVLPLPN